MSCHAFTSRDSGDAQVKRTASANHYCRFGDATHNNIIIMTAQRPLKLILVTRVIISNIARQK